jgi:hypothetical protein
LPLSSPPAASRLLSKTLTCVGQCVGPWRFSPLSLPSLVGFGSLATENTERKPEEREGLRLFVRFSFGVEQKRGDGGEGCRWRGGLLEWALDEGAHHGAGE